MWTSLAEHASLFAVDLPGFGASERREDLLSPRAMGEFLGQLIVEADLGTPHIVGPDVGTSAALFAAAAYPERIASVIVGTGGAAVPIQLGEPLASWVLDPDLDKYRAMDPHAIVGAAIDTIAGGVPDEIRTDYLDCYAGDRFAESMLYVRRYPEELPELAELLPRIATPVTIINGRHDRVVPLANAEFLDARLPMADELDRRSRPAPCSRCLRRSARSPHTARKPIPALAATARIKLRPALGPVPPARASPPSRLGGSAIPRTSTPALPSRRRPSSPGRPRARGRCS